MKEDYYNWGDRVKHDELTPCPDVSAYYKVYYQSGDWDEGFGDSFPECWLWSQNDLEEDVGLFITSYRVRGSVNPDADYAIVLETLKEVYSDGYDKRPVYLGDIAETLLGSLKKLQ